MKSTLTVLLCLLSFATSFGQSNQKKEEIAKAIIQGVFDDVWGGLDASKISKYHTEDFLLLEHGEVWNNDSIANYTVRAKKRETIPNRANSFEYIDIQMAKNIIWVAYHNHAVFTVNGEEVGKGYWLESAVIVKTKDGWKLRMLHSTRMPKK